MLGPAVSLFQPSYFKLMRDALKPGGVVCSQAGTVWANLEHVAQTLEHCRGVFNVAAFAHVAVPTYPSGQIGFVLGSLNSIKNKKNGHPCSWKNWLNLWILRPTKLTFLHGVSTELDPGLR
uniref:PABS domain-containing protein n=1 Tax=Timema genevievae TaxID=629358 RepID=A0A7R9K9A5_TIMGE|nr:unnamed protein product [Timema genevievae]